MFPETGGSSPAISGWLWPSRVRWPGFANDDLKHAGDRHPLQAGDLRRDRNGVADSWPPPGNLLIPTGTGIHNDAD
jgi:hypothetical protein